MWSHSKKGTVTIPAAIRKALALKPGQTVTHRKEGNKIILEFDSDLVRSPPPKPNARKK
ncbi:MAG: AbrB/MazE/SpoVT family DNA-binding domain-containing protein [Acidobacteria bacterium]|nr:AbrB/MazE/SpoVT family DNA-binding domain-containing protein [Acidobacteriota bacterium]